jgi:hypothetical protein
MPIFYLINAERFSMVPFVQPDEVMIVRYVQPLTQEQRQLLKTTGGVSNVDIDGSNTL